MNSFATGSSGNFFVRCWHGNARLWQAFWLVGVLGKLLVVTVATLAAYLLMGAPEEDVLVYLLFAPLLGGYLLYASVSIWRCAPNTKHSIWSVAARVVVIIVVFIWISALWQTISQ